MVAARTSIAGGGGGEAKRLKKEERGVIESKGGLLKGQKGCSWRNQKELSGGGA